MKALFASLVFMISSSAFALEFSDIAGMYRVTSAYPIVDIVTIDAVGAITLQETSPLAPGQSVNCVGQATITGNILSTTMTCDNGESFDQSIDFINVDYKATKFEAMVFSSALGSEVVPMTFERL